MTLDELPVGSYGKILEISDHPIAARLVSMGFVPGALIRAVSEAPFGDPRTYLVKDKLITLRNFDAKLVKIEITEEYVPLSHAVPGDYEIISVLTGPGLKKRLSRIGLEEGKRLSVTKNLQFLKDGGREIKLGKGIARRILVRRIEK